MSRRKNSPQAKPSAPKETPFFRPFEAVAREAKAKAEAASRAPNAPAPRAIVAPKPAPRPAPRPEASPGDAASFAQLFYGVEPLAPGRRARVPITGEPVGRTPLPPPMADSDDEVRAHLRALVEAGDDERFEVADDGRRIEGRRASLDATFVRRLRRGEYPVDGRLDLHGMSAREARDALDAFLKRARVARERVVLIVHGKGEHSPRGVGILRGEVAAWLSQGASSSHVAAFATAVADDGGEGALYVLLRR